MKGGVTMPTYDYVCPKCGHKETKIVKYEERNEQQCPQCNEQLEIDISTITSNLHNVG